MTEERDALRAALDLDDIVQSCTRTHATGTTHYHVLRSARAALAASATDEGPRHCADHENHDGTCWKCLEAAARPECRCVTRNGVRQPTFGCPVHPYTEPT